jgi:hypothetical protein
MAASFSQYVLAVHIAAVVVAFGVTFAYPIISVWALEWMPGTWAGFIASRSRSASA